MAREWETWTRTTPDGRVVPALSTRARQALSRFETHEEIAVDVLLRLRNVGRKTALEIHREFWERGVPLDALEVLTPIEAVALKMRGAAKVI